MNIIARFVGIDRHADVRIPELVGAKRDATALWALFTDNIPGIDLDLLVDEHATQAALRDSIRHTVEAAGPDDAVVLYFAGHGSPCHNLVVHDTDPGRFLETSIPMQDLAEAFRACRSKVVLFVLDCCFSGAAPNRVFADAPTFRSGFSGLGGFAGEGRYFLTACSDNEEAAEDPKTRHGLLTKALIDALTTTDNSIGLTALFAGVLSRVRADADRMGHTQTPQLLGMVSGGLTFPKLVPGNAYAAAFPDARGIMVSGEISELGQFGLPKGVLAAWEAIYRDGLNDLQIEAVNKHRVLDGASLLVVAPTSAGKTFIGEMSAAKAISNGQKAVFLLPYKALVNEKFDQFTRTYGQDIGFRVARCTGDFVDQTADVVRGKYDIALFTYEMFLNLALGQPGILNQIGLVVVDEAQFLTDPTRGISVELLLTMLISARQRGIEPQVVCLSAVIGDLNNFDAWLQSEKLITTTRPVELVEGVLDRSGTYLFIDSSGQVQSEQLLQRHAIVQRRDKPSAQDVIVPLVKKLVADGEQVIVFRNQRGSAQGSAKYLASDLGLPPANEANSLVTARDASSATNALKVCLAGGTAFHTANLSRDERELVERSFRDPESGVRVLAATTTVAAGINTPASTVILAENEFLGEDGRLFTVAEYKNMAGRAGRLGFNEKGKSIILADNGQERQVLFNRYVLGTPENMRSSFEEGHLSTWILRLLSQVKSVQRSQVPVLLANTYGGYIHAQRDPSWKSRTELHVSQLLVRMEELGLLESEDDAVNLSLLGKACGKSSLSFDSAMRLVALLRSVQPSFLTPEHLLVLLQAIPEASAYTPMFKKGTKESLRAQQASQRFSSEVVTLIQRGAQDHYDYWARCKRSVVLADWISGVPIEEIERRYSTTPFAGSIASGDIRRFADTTRLYLRGAAEISFLIHPQCPLAELGVDTLLSRLEAGIPERALAMFASAPYLDRGSLLGLLQLGLTTVDDCLKVGVSKLTELVGESHAVRLTNSTSMDSGGLPNPR